MKARTLILFVMIAFLLLGSVTLRLIQDSALAQSGAQPPPAQYIVGKGTFSGEHYRLTSLAWQARGAVGGGGYRLLGPAAPASSENGCCCTYLPCVLRQSP
jgi:hypothetical protein